MKLPKILIAGLGLAVAVSSALRADVTIRYKSDVRQSIPLPRITTQLKEQEKLSSPVIRMKQGKAAATTADFTTIIDLAKQEGTLVDTAKKVFATVPLAKFSDAMLSAIPQPPAAQADAIRQVMGSMKTTTESRKTGRTDVIQSIQAEETEITFSMGMVVTASGSPSMGNMKMVAQMWFAKPEESLRVAGLRELTGFNLWQEYFLHSAESIRKTMGQIPGFDGMATAMASAQQNQTLLLRTQTALYMPGMTALMAQIGRSKTQETSLPATDPDAPLMQMDQEVVELSSDPVADSFFEIPADFKAAPFEEVMQGMLPPALARPR